MHSIEFHKVVASNTDYKTVEAGLFDLGQLILCKRCVDIDDIPTCQFLLESVLGLEEG